MILVCIESPFRPSAPRGTLEFDSELALNIAYARALMLDSLRRGEAPFASHLRKYCRAATTVTKLNASWVSTRVPRGRRSQIKSLSA
jgi:hypothetical protein